MADGKFLILHDDTIGRTASRLDGGMATETRKITEMTYDEVAAYDYGVWFSFFRGNTGIFSGSC